MTDVVIDVEPSGGPTEWGREAKSQPAKVDGVQSIKIIDSSKVEIVRDRESLIGQYGLAHEVVVVSGQFHLGDADHIRLTYTLTAIQGNQIQLMELDESQLHLESSPRHKVRKIFINSY